MYNRDPFEYIRSNRSHLRYSLVCPRGERAPRMKIPSRIAPVVVVKIVSVLNYKGGVGKTTLSACAGQALALTGFRVLAIDNDPQHNLTAMLGAPLQNPTIRDVYHAPSIGIASQLLLKAARKTNVPNLQVVPSSGQVSTRDIKDPMVLQKCFAYSRLERFYDFAIIDNSPGMDLLQEAAIYASNEIFVPTELSQFALDGIVEMQDTLSRRFGEEHGISKIIPNFCRNIKAHDAFALAFRERFPGKVTATSIPFDSVFDLLVKRGRSFLCTVSVPGRPPSTSSSCTSCSTSMNRSRGTWS